MYRSLYSGWDENQQEGTFAGRALMSIANGYGVTWQPGQQEKWAGLMPVRG